MPVTFITAEQRLARNPRNTVAIFGPYGVGKTFQLRTLGDDTLALNLEAGMRAVDEEAVDALSGAKLPPFLGTTIDVKNEAAKIGVHPWEYCRALAAILYGGPDPAADPDGPYGPRKFQEYCAAIGTPLQFAPFRNVFTDSITVASRWAFSWAQRQPAAFSEKTGKPDTRGAYGLLGQELVTWLTMLQHCPDKTMIVVGVLEKLKDDFGRIDFVPQIEGSKAGRELPGIFDQVLTLANFSVDPVTGGWVIDPDKGQQRGFVCHQNNPFGVPAKDRSGRLALLEPPNLGALLNKLTSGRRVDVPMTTLPAQAVA